MPALVCSVDTSPIRELTSIYASNADRGEFLTKVRTASNLHKDLTPPALPFSSWKHAQPDVAPGVRVFGRLCPCRNCPRAHRKRVQGCRGAIHSTRSMGTCYKLAGWEGEDNGSGKNESRPRGQQRFDEAHLTIYLPPLPPLSISILLSVCLSTADFRKVVGCHHEGPLATGVPCMHLRGRVRKRVNKLRKTGEAGRYLFMLRSAAIFFSSYRS